MRIRSIALLALFVSMASTPLSAQAPAVWRVTEDLRIGSDAGPASFSEIKGIVPTRTNIFVLDWKSQEIRVFDAAGKFVRLAARKGKGPGEITNANGLAVDRDGNVWVNDPASARYSIYRPDGRFLRQRLTTTWGFTYLWGGVFDTAGQLVEPYAIKIPGGNTARFAYRRLAVEGALVDTIFPPSCPAGEKAPRPFIGSDDKGNIGRMMNAPFQPRGFNLIDARGGYWCTSGGDYAIHHFNLVTRAPINVVRSTAARPPVTPAERDSVIHVVDSLMRPYAHREVDYSSIPRVKPALRQIFTDDAGRLWVERTTPARAPSEFDVWDTSGRQLATVKLGVRVLTDPSPVVVGDSMYAITVDDDDVQYVIRVRIIR